MTQAQARNAVNPWIRTLFILPAYLFIVGLFQWAGYLVLGLDPSNFSIDKSPVQETIVALFTLTGTSIVVGLFRRFIDEESFKSMGFYRRGIRNEILLGIGLGALILATGFVTLVSIHEINWLGLKVEADNILLGFGLFVLVAFTEELLLRGYVLNNLMRSMNRLIALAISALMFSFIHVFNSYFSWLSFWDLFLGGILLGLPYIYTKSLWFPISLHFSWNFFQGPIFGFNVSGHDTYSLFIQSRTADTIWNGGGFGFEGSVLSIVFQLIAIGGMWWYYSRKEKINEINQSASPSGEKEADQEREPLEVSANS